MVVPSNLIKENLYTAGGHFVDINTKTPYAGYYCEINGKYFQGKTFNEKNPGLEKINNSTNIASNLFNSVFKNKFSNIIQSGVQKIKSINFRPSQQETDQGYSIRYFSKKLYSNPVEIKEIDLDTYKITLKDPTYVTVSIKYYLKSTADGVNQSYFDPNELNDASQKIPEIKIFLGV